VETFSIRIIWSDDDGGYIATSPEFEDLSAFGATPQEAAAQLESVVRVAIATYRDSGWPLPEPKRVHEHSGQLRLRLPKSLHGRLVEEADRDGVSLNTLIVTYLAQQVGRAASAVSASDPRRPVKHLRAMPVEE
jgi:antitoxin HicB